MKKMLMLSLMLVMAGCATPTTKIAIKQPGELKLTGVSKIAIAGFNTVDNREMGRYAASDDMVKLATKAVHDIFYKSPFYSLADPGIEKYILSTSRGGVKVKQKIDAFVYGKLWWEVAPHGEGEYHNIIPSKETLESWKYVRYQSGTTKDGKPVYSTARLTTQMKDEPIVIPYRSVNAALIMSISIYRMNTQGKIEKITQLFEISRDEAILKNGKLLLKSELVGKKEARDKAAMLKTKEESAITSFFNTLAGKQESIKVTGDVTVSRNLTTIPSLLNYHINSSEQAMKEFNKKVVPHDEEFELEVKAPDKVTRELILYSAYTANIKYIVEKILTQEISEAMAPIYERLDFRKGVAEALTRKHKLDFERENALKPPQDRKPYVAPEPRKIEADAEAYLAARVDYLYNLALSEEALGNFERALQVWRFAFHHYRPTDLSFADGIGRCLLALDMADKLSEANLAKIEANKGAYSTTGGSK
ncbi:hypothetical protein [Trichlorobacter ammonificans]|nr:hypothetical protein [Trichlorobacter ammonificans]